MTITDWIQAISMVVLVGITTFYAWRTHAISKATKEQSDASVKMAKHMVKPKLIPYLKLVGDFSADRYVQFEAGVDNDGNGPAYDIKGKIYDSTGENNDKRSDSSLMLGDIAVVLRGHQSASWSMPDPRILFPHSDKVLRRFFVIEYKDIDGKYEICQPFILTTGEKNKPIARLEGLPKKTLISKQSLEDELP